MFVAGKIAKHAKFAGQIAHPLAYHQAIVPAIETGDGCAAGTGLDQAENGTDGGGFAGTVGSKEAENFAAMDFEREVPERVKIAVLLC